jgi:SAM-dependent methyltransferase
MAASDPGGWNDPEMVERFAARDPDVRLSELLGGYPEPAAVSVLDLGCAGGRNTELLAARGFDVHAVDSAPAMVEAVRARLAPIFGAEEAARRVSVGTMRRLDGHGDAAYQLLVALGIFQQAQSEEEYFDALAEAARVLAPGGLCLVASFAPGTGTVDAPLEPVEGHTFLHHGLHVEHLCLRAPEDLDADFAAVGMTPVVPTKLVERVEGERRRVTANALYRRA